MKKAWRFSRPFCFGPDPIATGTRVTVRDEGFIGRSEAAYGNAEHRERVLGWLDAYLKRIKGL